MNCCVNPKWISRCMFFLVIIIQWQHCWYWLCVCHSNLNNSDHHFYYRLFFNGVCVCVIWSKYEIINWENNTIGQKNWSNNIDNDDDDDKTKSKEIIVKYLTSVCICVYVGVCLCLCVCVTIDICFRSNIEIGTIEKEWAKKKQLFNQASNNNQLLVQWW